MNEPKTHQERIAESSAILQVADYLTHKTADLWDHTLWDVYHENSGDDTFCGDAKELNKSFLYGADLLASDHEKFEIFNTGFIAGCGCGIDTLAEWITEKWDEEDD